MSNNRSRIIGTPDYISPEMIKGTDFNNPGGDFWSLGVMLFEFLTGIPPFNDDSIEKIFDNILNLRIPWDNINVGDGEGCMSEVAADFLKKMLVFDPTKRLNVEEIKRHRFFKGKILLKFFILNENLFVGIKWDNLSNMKAPIIPQWKNEYDTSNFLVNKMYDEKEIANPFFNKIQNTNQEVYIIFLFS